MDAATSIQSKYSKCRKFRVSLQEIEKCHRRLKTKFKLIYIPVTAMHREKKRKPEDMKKL